MFKHTIIQTVDVRDAVAATAAGTSTVTGTVIDTLGFESIAFYTRFGTITAGAVTSVKLQHGSAADGSDAADVTGATVSVPDSASNTFAVVEIHRPMKRYVRAVVSRATQNSVISYGAAILARSAVQPVTAVSSSLTSVTPPVVVGS